MTEPSPTVLVAVSSSPSGRAALQRAAQEAQRRGARLHLLRVWQDLPWHPPVSTAEASALRQQERAEQAILAEATTAAQALAPALELIFEFVPGDLVPTVAAVAEDADLVVVGAGRPEADSHLVIEHLRETLTCPVLVVDAPMPVHADAALAPAGS